MARVVVHPVGASGVHEGMGASTGTALTKLYVPQTGTVTVAVDAGLPSGMTIFQDTLGTVNQTIASGSSATFTGPVSGPLYMAAASDNEGIEVTITGPGYQ